MNIKELNEHHGLPGVLTFEESKGLVCAQVTTPAAAATIYLQGAHITHWQPKGHDGVLYLSPKSDFEEKKPIRGGIPICFPWFAQRSDGGTGPSHGFARIQPWEVAFAALAGEELHLTFTLGANELSRSMGFDHFRVAYELMIGSTLRLRFTVANLGDKPMHIEEALHTYFAIPDIREISITGLEGAEYIDKVDHFTRKRLPNEPLKITQTTDRVYPGQTGPCTIHTSKGTITNTKTGSNTTVTWNPWSLAVPDLPSDGWEHFVCVETANAGANAVTIAPGASYQMEAEITLSRSKPVA